MKKLFAIVMAVAMLVALVPATVVFAGNLDTGGTLSGAHYNLNIIGAPYDKNVAADDFTFGGNGSRIFVDRGGTTQFYVYGSTTSGYEVRDHNGTDGRVGTGFGPDDAGIILPYRDGAYKVAIYVRLVGPKSDDNTMHWLSQYTTDGGVTYGLIGEFDLSKSSKFTVKTSELLKDGYQDILWTVDTGTKFRICQLRIYEIP